MKKRKFTSEAYFSNVKKMDLKQGCGKAVITFAKKIKVAVQSVTRTVFKTREKRQRTVEQLLVL